jgi:DNA-binding winged helix-turn-helix (wHTH) protein
MHDPTKPRYSFGPFLLDPVEKVLLRGQDRIHLPPKAFETLLTLVENQGHILEKAELLNLVWPNTFVEEATLAQNIFVLRKVLEGGTNGHEYIETVPKRGYRFVAPVCVNVGKSLEEPAGLTSHSASPPTSAPTRRAETNVAGASRGWRRRLSPSDRLESASMRRRPPPVLPLSGLSDSHIVGLELAC